MKIKSFFKLLNRKIEKYNNATSNPFKTPPLPIVIVWVEEPKTEISKEKTKFD